MIILQINAILLSLINCMKKISPNVLAYLVYNIS